MTLVYQRTLALLWIGLSLCCFGSRAAVYGQSSGIDLVDITEASGVDFVHSHGGSDMGYIVEGMSTGLATFDYDADGLVDIYFLNGAALKGTVVAEPYRNRLYRNNGNGTFADVTEEAGVGDTGYGLGVSVADYDGDGDLDIYINNFGPNVLYRNNGDKTFTDVTEEAGVVNGNRVGAGVGFFDMDGDDDLDLYVANYVDFTYENHVPIVIKGQRYQAGPQYYKPVSDTLYRNKGDGTFEDVSQAAGISAVAGPSMGLICADLDDDLDIDVYVCNDGEPNFLFQNDGTGKFEEVGLLYGVACDFNGKANSSMGVDCADFNGDGWLDLFVTNYQAEMPVLYRNVGGGLFEDATSACRITNDLFPHVNWGTGFVDFDNDSDLDLFIACGHFDRIEQIDDRTAMKIKNYLLANEDGRFEDVTDTSGSGLTVVETSRGAAFEDFDNDGDVDVVVVNSNARPTLIRNETTNANHWVELELEQPGMNRFAVGARLTIRSGDHTQTAVALSGRGYQSHFGTVQHFGLGKWEQPVEVTVRWPDGTEQDFQVPADQRTKLVRKSN